MAQDKHVDLNLLRVFMTVCRTGSITLAAEELNLNQSSVSNAITRFKNVVGEPLFLRAGRGVEPTSFAQNLFKELEQSMDTINQLLTTGSFDPIQTRREFKVVASDFVIQQLLQPLQELLQPLSVTVVFKEFQGGEQQTDDILSLEKADLVIDMKPKLDSGWHSQKLISESIVVIARHNHPRLKKGLSLQAYLSEQHVFYRLRESNTTVMEQVLNARFPKRNMLSEHSSCLSMFATVKKTDAVGLTLTSYAEEFAPLFDLQVLEPPFTTKPFEFYMIWHKKFTNNPAHQWLRESIVSVVD
ncbi:HTH-type transcriptional regulator LeuO [Sinobacterium norvegicum]|uniref:HTH-type transcriptional regulator LeuO n=1 Tax=Sinobacterium norvegicum TaxID=1641715 RepID=A0ABN8EFD5_9GAMM|nr:LysR family transcriptional regulator [Sinobacterium norvegicum]CAH0991113.1 HTH-type transcriptional regulator LeuO [Sinobacterium norvegicum]